jgi:hypothetical protein
VAKSCLRAGSDADIASLPERIRLFEQVRGAQMKKLDPDHSRHLIVLNSESHLVKVIELRRNTHPRSLPTSLLLPSRISAGSFFQSRGDAAKGEAGFVSQIALWAPARLSQGRN